MDEGRLLEIGTISGLTKEQRSLLGPLGPDDIAARWFEGAVLAAYYFDNGDIVIAPRNYELRPGDEVVASGWAAVAFTLGPNSELHLAGGLRRWDGPPPGADDPNYDADPNWWVSD